MPDVQNPPLRLLILLFFTVFAVGVLWPSYLAISIPGWPWITPSHIVQLGFALAFLVCFSVAADFRSQLSAVLRNTHWLTSALLAFIALEFVSIAWSSEPFSSFDKFITLQLTWTAAFLGGCVIFLKNGRVEKMAILLVLTAVALCPIGLLEDHLGRIPWAGHIPSFLQVEDPTVQATLAGTSRQGRHRVDATFETSLSLAEYLALAFPFALHFAVRATKPWMRICAAATLPLLFYVILLTQARLGVVGAFVACVLYPLGFSFLRARNTKGSLLSNAVAHLSPAFLLTAIAAAFTVPPIKKKLFGGGGEALSTASRIDQLNMGIPKIISQPWGYGLGRGGQALNYHTPGGFLTIDSYWLLLTMELGPLGLALFLSIFAAAFYYIIRGLLAGWSREREIQYLLPIGCALTEFFYIRIAFAQDHNMQLFFALLAMAAALTYRATADRPEEGRQPALKPTYAPKRLGV